MDTIRARVKVLAAAVAAGAVVAMGALTATFSSFEAPKLTAMPAGDTVTQAPTPPPTASIPMAVPPVKAPKWHAGRW
jgi:hypothetical protein